MIRTRALWNRRLVVLFSLLAGGLLLGNWARAQEVAPHHLVGHEEAELLLRIQDVIDDWDPRKLKNPLVTTSHAQAPDGSMIVKKQLRRPDLAEFIADVDAAEALGKAFFWEMQAGSDFSPKAGQEQLPMGTACATCHYRHGADARTKHTRRIPYVAWDQYKLHDGRPLEFGETQQPYPVGAQSTEEFNINQYQHAGPFSLIVGSQGVEPLLFKGFKDPLQPWLGEESIPRSLEGFSYRPQWSMFVEGSYARDDETKPYKKFDQTLFRQITARNSPSVINSGFSDRLFHDGRAESTFNGFSIFGDADQREVIHRVQITHQRDKTGQLTNDFTPKIVPVHVAITKAALASQAVGPIVNDVEMSSLGREFPHVAHKLLKAKVLGYQTVAANDSLLSRYPAGQGQADGLTYQELIQRAFRSEWWDDSDPRIHGKTPLVLLRDSESVLLGAGDDPHGELIVGNFSLFWGLSIMLYEASLVTNQSPFDEMMRGRPEMVEAKWATVKDGSLLESRLHPIARDQRSTPQPDHVSGAAVFQHGFRVFLNRGCVDCHDGPLFSELYERAPEEEKLPIHYRLERALLPNSRADSLAANLRVAHQSLLDRLESIVSAIPEAQPRSRKVAIELDELRHSSRGIKSNLHDQIEHYLNSAFHTPQAQLNPIVEAATKALFDYEKSLASRMGNRTFFTEDERIAMAEAIGGPLLLEKMGIPKEMVPTRPKLPIHGQLATEGYAFYDAGFYALGVALPRYDRGIGDKQNELNPQEEALLQTIADLSSSNDPSENEAGLAAMRSFRANQDVASIVEGLPGKTKESYDQKLIGLTKDSQRSASEASGAPGNAYKFRRSWNTDRYKSDLLQNNTLDPFDKNVLPKWVQPNPSFAPDKDARKAGIDTSWDRIDLPYGDTDPDTGDDIDGAARRSHYYFLSRARRMVFNEDHWGYRQPFLHDNELAFWGSFKTPSLRNVELTAPYMHNGRFMTLSDVVDFYDDLEDQNDRKPQLPRDNPSTPDRSKANPDKHPAIRELDGATDDDKKALVFFLLCLTDDRVRYEKGPFDHPSLRLVNGYKKTADGKYEEDPFSICEVGETGHSEYRSRFGEQEPAPSHPCENPPMNPPMTP